MFFITTVIVQGQTKYGVLVKTTLFPNMGWDGHAGSHTVSIGSMSINKSTNFKDVAVIEYDFFNITGNPTIISCVGGTIESDDGTDCNTSRSIVYNKDTFIYDGFYGCIASSEIIGIYLKQPADTKICKEKTITLSHGWNWQYSYDAEPWSDFPSAFQARTSVSFKLTDLPNSDGKKKINIKTGYSPYFSDVITYDIIPCSPNIVGDPVKVNTLCSYSNDGQVTFTFDRDIAENEHFKFNIFDDTDGRLVDDVDVYPAGFPDRKFTYSGLAKGQYFLRYQTFIGTQETSTADSAPFTISNPPVFNFQVLESPPYCHDDFGTINISPAGGTSPYYYKINTDPEVEFTTAITIQKKSGDYSIKVRDSKNCIDTTANN